MSRRKHQLPSFPRRGPWPGKFYRRPGGWFPLFVMAVLLSVALPAVYGQGCAMCKTALENSPEGRALAGSFNYGILFLMGIPYAMFAVAGVFIFRAFRRRAAETEKEAQQR
jgi:hypothetical protein